MRGRALALAAVLVGIMAGAGPAAGQIAWESPMLIGPGAPAGFGIFVMDPAGGNDVAVMGTYRTSPVPVGLGFRLGLGEDGRDDLSVFGGVDISGFLARTEGEVPIDILWFTGAGAGISDDVLLSFPLGLSFGANLESEDVIFRPYVAPRVVLDAFFDDDEGNGPGDDDDLDLSLAVDLGVDIAFDPAWLIRFAASVGDREALLIGVAFPR